MNKAEFLEALAKSLQGLPEDEVEKSLDFYREAMDDRIEEGMTEEEAAAALGPIDDIAREIFLEQSLTVILKSKNKNRRKLRGWEFALLLLGSPLWLPLLLALCLLTFSVYAVIWVLIITLWAADFTLALGFPAGVIEGVMRCSSGSVPAGLFLLGSGLVCGGLAVLWFLGTKNLSRRLIRLTVLFGRWIKGLCIGRETA